MSVKPYTISVPDTELKALSQRLTFTKFPTQLDGEDQWETGVPLSEVSRLIKYWKDGFDWRKAEAQLNKLPNFTTNIEVVGFGGIDVHFVHQTSPVEGAIPLLFCHGWPGSFIEVKKLLPLLHGGKGSPAFHIVAPSLPNFGFSSGVTKRGFGIAKYAETLNKLMLRLGYNEYVTQGGDWGFPITRAIGIQYSNHCKASHLNVILANPPKFSTNPLLSLQHATTPYTDSEKAGLERTAWFGKEAYGYNLLQSTKPQTIGYALADSPVALLSWIFEKFHDWTHSYPWTDDEILTWVSIYWFSTAGPAAGARIYYEATHPQPPSDMGISVATIGVSPITQWVPRVKLGLSYFPKELSVLPRTWGRTLGPVCFEKEHESGGHFAAWEVPDALAGDLKAMFGEGGPCYGIVKGKSGY